MRFKSFFFNTGVIIFGIIVILFVLELISRMLFSNSIVLFPRYHSEAVYGEFHIRRIRPNTVFWHTSRDGQWKFEINSQGFRNKFDFRYEKPDSLVRVVCLGDSHTEGFEVRQEHTYASVLEKELLSKNMISEVYNMGVSGYGTDEELILLENEVVKYKPNYVVIGFFANDYEDNLKTGLFSIKDSFLINVKKENLPAVRILDLINQSYIIRKLSENSYLYSFCFNTIWDIVKRSRASMAKQEAANVDTLRSYAIATKSVRTKRELQLTEKLLLRLFNFAKENGIGIIFIDIPQDNLENSLDPSMEDFVMSNVSFYVNGKSLVEPYRRHVDTHVPNGQRHISEFTHMMIGMELAKFISQTHH